MSSKAVQSCVRNHICETLMSRNHVAFHSLIRR